MTSTIHASKSENADKSMKTKDSGDLDLWVNADCACFQIRRASRILTRAYDKALQATGLKINQIGVLVAVRELEPATMQSLAEALGMDRTTLVRNIRPLQRDGYLTTETPRGTRAQQIFITEKALQKLQIAMPLWKQAQTSALSCISTEDWEAVRRGLLDVSEIDESALEPSKN